MNAFHGNAAVKRDVLETLAGSTETPVAMAADQQAVLAWAQEMGLPGDLTLLLAGLARHSERGAGKACYDVLETVEPGADLSAVMRQWPIWAIGTMLVPVLSTPGLRQAADTVQRLLGAASPTPSDWRRVRHDLACIDVSDDDDGALATLSAACWDLERFPGAVDDILTSWHQIFNSRLHREVEWTEDVRAAFRILLRDATPQARAQAGPMPEPSDEIATRLYKTRLLDAYEPLLLAKDETLSRRGMQILRGPRAEISAFSDDALSGLVQRISGTPSAAGGLAHETCA